MKIFLGGTCAESTWRQNLIKLLKIDYFDPVVKDWDEKAKKQELYERKHCDFLLYYITPKMEGVYSISEVTEDSIKNSQKTIFSFCTKDDDKEFNKKQINSLKEVGNLIKRNGGTFIESGSLQEIANFVNKKDKGLSLS